MLHRTNVVSAVIVSENLQYGIVGAYVPLSDTTTSVRIAVALGCFPNRKVIPEGDLNFNLDLLETDRDRVIADILVASGLLDMYQHFKLRRKLKRQTTWHQKCKENVVQSRLDYFLCSDQRIIRP